MKTNSKIRIETRLINNKRRLNRQEKKRINELQRFLKLHDCCKYSY